MLNFEIVNDGNLSGEYGYHDGFFNCVVRNTKTNKTYNYQACLMQDRRFNCEGKHFRNKVDLNDTGGRDGICGDVNGDLIKHLADEHPNCDFENLEKWIIQSY